MDFIDRIREIAARIETQSDHIKTEEATKNALIMPLISALGYDVFNPREVIPEFTADVGVKKNEKVDYAIKHDGDIIILVECKWSGADLHKEHASQLYRYFSVTDARFGLLTNGVIYQFFSDLEEPNKMDSRPFFEFDLRDFQAHQLKELKKFQKEGFSLDDILTTANTLKYTQAIKKVLEQELENPSEEFVKFFLSRIYDGIKTAQVIEQFTSIVKQARNQFVNEKVNSRLKSALNPAELDSPEEDNDSPPVDDNGIVTTAEEIEAFNIVRAILREVVPLDRVAMRDTKSYCGVLLDDNNRKPVCRFHFNTQQQYLGLIKGKEETRQPIDKLEDIFGYAEEIKAAVADYI